MNKNLLIVDDDSSLVRVMQHHLTTAGYIVKTAQNGIEGIELHKIFKAAVIFTDIKMPEMGGLDFVKEIREFDPYVSIVVMTGYPTIDNAVSAMKAGALDFIEKPVEKDHLLAIADKACSFNELQTENTRLRNLVSEHLDFGNMIGHSPAIQAVYKVARSVADSNVTVLITGETGTGKEMLAKALHYQGRRRNKKFVAINCAAVPSHLLESELFGHVKGAFTGAIVDRSGLISDAEGGTLFLDEIGDLPIDLQPKLLRVLQEREFHPVGSNQSIKTDARIVVATHRDLKKMVEEQTFRQDLYYRLNVVPIEIPPVRERKDDIIPLFLHFLKEAAVEEHKAIPGLDKRVIDCFEKYAWPGNVREIQNIAQRIMAIHSGTMITLEDLPDSLVQTAPENNEFPELPEDCFDLEAWTDKIILKALQMHKWNQSKTAAYLNISRNTLIYRMNKNNLFMTTQE
ncbi:MAG: sigma-54-dependent Fis family transcriptional regulator [Fibrobacter sp.]|nr:sigma-54-dependent Fis family transcriptional regulator [Fibrobacter sp.]